MGSIWGNLLKLSIFGESHGPGIGMVLDGFPAGVRLDPDQLAAFLRRRAPGRAAHATARKESDRPRLLSGVLDGVSTGAPIALVIENQNTRSGDYAALRFTPRPGHADYTGQVRYGGHNDLRGGGHFSGRLTAPLTAAGGLCLPFLSSHGVSVHAHIAQIGEICDEPAARHAGGPALTDFPVYCREQGEAMQRLIAQAKEEGDSVGGVIECTVTGLPAGLGSPMMDTVESRLSSLLFAVPAVKGVAFGDGFALAGLRGSQANDALGVDRLPPTNHNGGVLGGITNGAPVVFRAVIKPTPSIARAQRTLDLSTGQMTDLHIQGRHDPCIVPRAVPVMEAAAALVCTDLWLEAYGYANS